MCAGLSPSLVPTVSALFVSVFYTKGGLRCFNVCPLKSHRVGVGEKKKTLICAVTQGQLTSIVSWPLYSFLSFLCVKLEDSLF